MDDKIIDQMVIVGVIIVTVFIAGLIVLVNLYG